MTALRTTKTYYGHHGEAGTAAFCGLAGEHVHTLYCECGPVCAACGRERLAAPAPALDALDAGDPT